MQKKKNLKMSRLIFGLAMCIFVSAGIFAVDEPTEPTNEPTEFYLLNDVKLDKKTVKVTTSGQVKYNVFKTSKPPRLVIDLYNTEHNLAHKVHKVTDDVVEQIRTGQFRDKPTKTARVVLDLKKLVDYEATQKDNDILLTLITGAIAASPQLQQVTTGPTPVKPAAVTSAPSPLPTKVSKPAPSPAATKLSRISKPAGTKKAIVLPRTSVTFDFVDADIRDVLQVMSVRSGINIIYGPDVTGPPDKPETITISLRDVPFGQAFYTVLSLKGLTTVPVADNVLRVLTPVQLTKERAEGVTFTKVFPLNYAEPGEVKAQLDSVRSAEGRTQGSVTIDDRTNSLIVTDTREGLISTEKLIAELDKKPLQVCIEAKLVDITLSDLLELGVNWSGTQVETVSGGGMRLKGGDVTAGPIKVTKPDVSGVKEVEGVSGEVVGTIPGTGGIFNFGLITDNLTLGAKLAALATEGKLKVLASPKVTTINNKEAKILIGEKVPYKTTTVTSGPSPIVTETWEYIDAGVKLTVTPTINPDKVITLKVKPEVSVPAEAVPGAAPAVRSREADVTVMIKDNDTLVIGGLIREEDIKNIQKVPLLGDLPILGYLFKYRKDTKTRTELAVFLTPKIVPD